MPESPVIAETGLTPLQHIEDLTVWSLAQMVDGVSDPDTSTSPGGLFLAGIRNSFVDEIARLTEDGADVQGELHEMAEAEVSPYSHTVWQTYTDLTAYQVDMSGIISEVDVNNATEDLATPTLIEIALQLFRALWDSFEEMTAEAMDEDADGDDDKIGEDVEQCERCEKDSDDVDPDTGLCWSCRQNNEGRVTT